MKVSALQSFIRISLMCGLFLSVITGAHYSAAQDANSALKFEPFPHARMMFDRQEKANDYLLALGSYKKVGGFWTVDHHRRLSGDLTRQTLELPSSHSAEDGFEFYLNQLRKLSARQLFICKARECGPSNSWANNHFNIIQLYGSDQHQYFAAYEVVREDLPPSYVSLYAVMRGNKRVYVQLDVLQTSRQPADDIASDVETLLNLLMTQDYYVFPGLTLLESEARTTVKFDDTHVQSLIQLLKQQQNIRVALVGHDYGAGGTHHQQSVSVGYVDQLKAVLVKAGVADERIETYGVGSFAPAGRANHQSARIEVVRLSNTQAPGATLRGS